ncbi:hypothetical protein PR048_030763 [Dryococelus australis]|uniref:Uncharacterized protein n=1 Tax=Dryococelus australis TaxID=614101 RepID=A0ABQ9GA99_9NEOP|nr:hypothetical protein PR048_030763 [Dryococelus australis]
MALLEEDYQSTTGSSDFSLIFEPLSCRRLLFSLVEKLLQKSPITYSTGNSLSCLDTLEMATCKDKQNENGYELSG